MVFKELPKGAIFELLTDDGRTVTAIKISDKHALTLADGEELKIYPTKKVELPRAMRPGEFAVENETGKPLIVEEVKPGFYRCDYILRVCGGTLHESQVSVFDRNQGKGRKSKDEVYIILDRATKDAKRTQNALIVLKDMVEDLDKVT